MKKYAIIDKTTGNPVKDENGLDAIGDLDWADGLCFRMNLSADHVNDHKTYCVKKVYLISIRPGHGLKKPEKINHDRLQQNDR